MYNLILQNKAMARQSESIWNQLQLILGALRLRIDGFEPIGLGKGGGVICDLCS